MLSYFLACTCYKILLLDKDQNFKVIFNVLIKKGNNNNNNVYFKSLSYTNVIFRLEMNAFGINQKSKIECF